MKRYGPYIIQNTYPFVTVPKEVREVLSAQQGDLVVWEVRGNSVRLRKAYLIGQNGEGGVMVDKCKSH